MTRIDPRLRAAVDASLCWYDAVCALHGVSCSIVDGLWVAQGPPPALHSAVKTAEPWVTTAAAVQAMPPVGHGSIADSFARLEPLGLDLLFEAQWIHQPPIEGASLPCPAGWARVDTPAALAPWNAHQGTTQVLIPAVLHRSSFTVLACWSTDEPPAMVAGAVLHLAGGVLSLSNVWSASGHDLDWAELVALAQVIHPGRALTGYARGDDLERARQAGFATLGPQRVWVR